MDILCGHLYLDFRTVDHDMYYYLGVALCLYAGMSSNMIFLTDPKWINMHNIQVV